MNLKFNMFQLPMMKNRTKYIGVMSFLHCHQKRLMKLRLDLFISVIVMNCT